MSNEWRDRPERGGRRITRFYIWLCLTVGRRLARVILYGIALYFVLSAPRERMASAGYLARVKGKTPGPLEIYRHFFTFSTVIMDRLFFLAGRTEQLSVALHGETVFDEMRAENRGFLLASAHFGSFEALRVMGISGEDLPVKALMHTDTSSQLNELLSSFNPAVTESVIPLGRPGAMLDVKEWVDNGGIVGILADRITDGEKMIDVDFLGAPAAFPLGPWLLAGMLKVPVLLCFAVYRGKGHYDIYFEMLTDAFDTDRRDRQAAAERLAARYADRLAYYCRLAPYNWFNLFDFWNHEKTAAR
jgi:predicted LPLAT superfamily acyltransferase